MTHDGISWGDLPLTADHAAYLERHAITPAVAQRAGLRSVTEPAGLPGELESWGDLAVPGIVFPWRSPHGVQVDQVRPDTPVVWKDEEHKYLWPAGQTSVLNAVLVDAEATRVLIVEGTKQCLAAASYAPAETEVYGLGGCRNWYSEQVPIADLDVVDGKDVVIALDADVATNLDVYTAGIRLSEAVRAEGAVSVKFARLTGAGTTGLDDVLALRPESRRSTYLLRLIEGAKPKPADTKPAARRQVAELTPSDAFFEQSIGLLVEKLSNSVRDRYPAALTQEHRIALYRDGMYHLDGAAFTGTVAGLLGDRFRPAHREAVEQFTMGILYNLGRFLPVHVDHPLLNVKNGMLDLATGTLKPHDPTYMSSLQIPVEWDEDARCPQYEDWLRLCGIDDQADDLEEVTATMLDPSRTPPKAVFLFGPSRSGKSTFLRLMQGMVGPTNVSGVTLHQLSINRFAAANVYGKMLNCAADLSSAHVEDISIFKMMTGEDLIQADRKYGGQFAFTNRALFAFSANELPTVGESSRAYSERIKPFEFATSFAGRENPAIEQVMLTELPGILVRWVRAYQRMLARGTYLPTSARVREEFEIRSDRVRQWVRERCIIWSTTPDGSPVTPGTAMPPARSTAPAKLAEAFNIWAEKQAGSRMGQRKVIDRLVSMAGVYEVRQTPNRVRALNVTLRSDDGDVWDEPETPDGSAGRFEGPRAVLEGPRADSASETAREFAQVTGLDQDPRAERAVLTPTVEHSDYKNHPTRVEANTESDFDFRSSGVVNSGSETARSARAAREGSAEGSPETATGATEPAQGALFDTPPAGKKRGRPAPPVMPRRVVRPVDAHGLALAPNTATTTSSPLATLLADSSPAVACPHCGGRKQLVPPSNFWYACRTCYPATFESGD